MEKPNLNTGVDWDDLDDRDLIDCVDDQQSVAEIADYLSRTNEEVRTRMGELGLKEAENFHPER